GHRTGCRGSEYEPQLNLHHGREEACVRINNPEQKDKRRNENYDEQGVQKLNLIRRKRIRPTTKLNRAIHIVPAEENPKIVVLLVRHPEQDNKSKNTEQTTQGLSLLCLFIRC